MARCVSGKKCHESQELAEEALVENHIHFNHAANSGPLNVYLCNDCAHYHFTSKGEPHPILIEKSDYIRTQKRAREWEGKL